MGKHERKKVEEAEKIIVKILNLGNISNFDKQNHWFRHAVSIAKSIKKDFPNIKEVHHLGNRYDNTGDILLVTSDKRKTFIEVKMSDTKLGVGTKANISQDALTENYLFIGKVKSWSEFRKNKKHSKWIDSYLALFSKYPKKILNISNLTVKREKKARYLRKLKQQGNKKAKEIFNKIHERDKKEKIEYLSYLSKQPQRKEMVKRFFILITLGIHKKGQLQALIKEDDFFQEIQDILVYYGNSYNNKILVRKEDSGKKIKKLLQNFSDFKIIFPSKTSHCKLVGTKRKKDTPLLQIVLHWKNIAQGIKTPCLNIFDLTSKLISLLLIWINWEQFF